MKLLDNEPIIIEHGTRLYTAFCNKCGHAGESETETTHRLICGKCGNDTFRHIRDHAMSELLLNKGKGIVQ